MSEKTCSVRRFAMSDVSNVVQLLRTAFKVDFSEEWWSWKYKSNPAGFCGPEGDVWVAESGNKVVGYWAVIPEKLKLGSETVTVAQACDASTHPDYRRRGIYGTLVRKILSDIQNRYEFLFTFARENAYKALVKYGCTGFRIPGEFVKFINYDRPLRSFFTNNLAVWSGKVALKSYQTGKRLFSFLHRKKSTIDSVEIQRISQFPDEIDDFWKLVRSDYEVCLERTAAFLNWRFSKPFGEYQIYLARSVQNKKIVGYLVVKKTTLLNIQNVLDIVDLQVLPDEDKCVLNLIDTAINIAKNEELDLIHCRVPLWHRYSTLLSKRGFLCMDRLFSWLKIYQPRIVFYPFKKEESIPKIFRQWFYTYADTDYA